MTSRIVFIAAIVALLLPAFLPAIESGDIQVADISFIDESHGWISVMDPSPAVLRTADGGKTWTHLPVPVPDGFYKICFHDVNTGIAVQSQSDGVIAIYWTVNGGETWTKVNTVKDRHYISALHFIGGDDVLLTGGGEPKVAWLAQLSNQGRTLKIRDDLPAGTSTQADPSDIFDDGAGHVWFVGRFLILYSADNGKTWEDRSSASALTSATSGAAVPGGHAWLIAQDEDIYKTDDYGAHWRDMQRGNGMSSGNISFANNKHGCAVGQSSLISCTDDGGKTWPQSEVFESYIEGSPMRAKLHLFKSSKGWASVGGVLYRTDDGGYSFTQILPAPQNTQSEIPGESQALRTSINGPGALALDNTGYLYIIEEERNDVLRLDLNHASIKVLMPPEHLEREHYDYPNCLATDQRGKLFIGDFSGRLRELDLRTGAVSVLVPTPPLLPIHGEPESMLVDPGGNLIIAIPPQLVRWDPGSRTLLPFAGAGWGFGGDGGPAKNAKSNMWKGIALNRAGDFVLLDRENCRIRKIDGRTMLISTIAGTGECEFDSKGDGGPAIKATMEYPDAMAIDSGDNIYFVDGHRVRRIDPNGTITAYAGTGEVGFGGDGGPAVEALLNNPCALAVDLDGNLYIAEFVNNRIRKVDAKTHIISTIAGNGFPHRHDSME